MQQYGKVNSSTTRWVPISNFSILDKGMRDGIDYHTLSFERRDVDLDDLKAPIGHVVVRFDFTFNKFNLTCLTLYFASDRS